MKHKWLDHTADIGIVVEGENPQNLFRNAARTMFEIIADPEGISARRQETIVIEGENFSDLMINWLRELLYIWSGRKYLLSDVTIETIDENRLEATVQLDFFQPDRHKILYEIKAVTYHLLEVHGHQGKWEATIVFDV
jgi:SHS2 domain-containing protein